jgi:hypothetical protein
MEDVGGKFSVFGRSVHSIAATERSFAAVREGFSVVNSIRAAWNS